VCLPYLLIRKLKKKRITQSNEHRKAAVLFGFKKAENITNELNFKCDLQIQDSGFIVFFDN